MPDVIMHVNYFEAGNTLATLFDKAKCFGYEGVELRGFRQDTATPDYLQEIKREWERTGLKHVILSCPAELNNPSAAERAASIEKCSAMLRQAAALGVKLFNAMAGTLLAEGAAYFEFARNGSAAATDEQWQWAVEGYQQLGAVADELGVRLAFETHNCYIHDLAKPTAEFLRRIGSPAVGANLDMGNLIINANGESTVEACRILGERIFYAHLKNLFRPTAGGWIVCALPDGVIDNRVLLRTLKGQGYNAPICLEAPRAGDRDHFARQDIEYIRWVLEGLDWA